MATQPIANILQRNDPSRQQDRLNKIADLIEETVNYGTHIIDWDAKEGTGGDENIPVIMSFRHILELLDAISVLVRSGSVEPCKPLLRVILDAFFTT